jgi:hypothetical protein
VPRAAGEPSFSAQNYFMAAVSQRAQATAATQEGDATG